MNFYLNYLKAEEMEAGENPPLGILLCSAKNETLAFDGRPEDAKFLQHYEIKPSELPKPRATRSSDNDQRIHDHPAGARSRAE